MEYQAASCPHKTNHTPFHTGKPAGFPANSVDPAIIGIPLDRRIRSYEIIPSSYFPLQIIYAYSANPKKIPAPNQKLL